MLDNFFKPTDTIHFSGIGGIGMSAIAKFLIKLGHKISGSDKSRNSITDFFEKNGIDIKYTQKKENLYNANFLVISSAIKNDNPEYQYAIEKNIPVLHRSEVLGYISDLFKKSICITGSHGKTSTTSLLSHVMHISKNASAITGGIIDGYNSNVLFSEDTDYFIYEGDESDASILSSVPSSAIITNISLEHLDFYKTKANLMKTFLTFAKTVENFLVINQDCNTLKELDLKSHIKKLITYGVSKESDYCVFDIEQKSTLNFKIKHKEKIYEMSLSGLYGEHNAVNACGVFAVCIEHGLTHKEVNDAFSSFKGIYRRMHKISGDSKFKVFDDYAHHSKEVKCTLESMEKISDDFKIIFQPHKYSRLQACFDDFVEIFSKTKHDVYITDVYGATEDIKISVDSNDLISKIKKSGKINVFSLEQLAIQGFIRNRKSDIILMNAGNLSNEGKLACDFLDIIY